MVAYLEGSRAKEYIRNQDALRQTIKIFREEEIRETQLNNEYKRFD